MSTYVYLECLDHTPALKADAESGQHLTDLPQIREDIADRVEIGRKWTDGDYYHEHPFRRATARFLAAHPTCRIGIRDEYGREHPAEVDPDAEVIARIRCQVGDSGHSFLSEADARRILAVVREVSA